MTMSFLFPQRQCFVHLVHLALCPTMCHAGILLSTLYLCRQELVLGMQQEVCLGLDTTSGESPQAFLEGQTLTGG